MDLLALGSPEAMSTAQTDIQKTWDEFYTTAPVFQELAAAGKYAHVDLEFSDGHFTPTEHAWVGGPDEFELVIGNYLVYSVPLHQKGDYLEELKAQQIVDILGLPELYQQLLRLFEIENFESPEILHKANILRNLLEEYTLISFP